MNCASGFEALTQAAEKIAAGRGDIFLVGGTENMSRYPLLSTGARRGTGTREGANRCRRSANCWRFVRRLVPRVTLQLGL
jgi:acetyl-CoA C-acetyltransferase/acetyl-CoA acyltransferase